MEVFRSNSSPLAFCKATGSFQYDDVGMFVLTYFAAKIYLPILSPIAAVIKAADVDSVFALSFAQ